MKNHSEHTIAQQEAAFSAFLQSLGTASHDEITELMAEREKVEPEPELTSDMVQKLQSRISAARSEAQPVAH